MVCRSMLLSSVLVCLSGWLAGHNVLLIFTSLDPSADGANVGRLFRAASSSIFSFSVFKDLQGYIAHGVLLAALSALLQRSLQAGNG